MAHHQDDEFSAIDPSALDQVTGGKDASSGTSSGSSGDDQLKSVLEGISSTLKDLKNNGNGNNNFFNQMMPFLLMAFAGRGGSITIAGGGHACGCGCGGRGRCCRR